MRGPIFPLLTVIAATAFAASIGLAQQKSLKEQLVGAWTLVSAESKTKDGVDLPYLEGTNLKGLLIFDGSGLMSYQIMADIPKLASNNRTKTTPEENEAIAHRILSYFGTYSIGEADHTLTQRVEASSFANQVGVEGKRIMTLTAPDELKMTVPVSLAGNTNITYWSRAK